MEISNIKRGGISVETSHIFPIIKKWLYSEKDIFLREIVSNAADAITKLKRLESLGQYDSKDSGYSIKVILDKDEKTLTVSDNGIGMCVEELEKYICSIALSGAVDFVNKYDDGESRGIIGHFGLGFYSSFMVSDTVEVITKSFMDDPAVHWICNASGEYEILASDKESRGTDIIMHINDDEAEYLEEYKIRAILDKYCSFMAEEIYFEAVKDEENEENEENEEKEAPSPINNTTPLWLKSPSECTEEEYNEFYKKVFGDFRDPLFYVHINADYPLNFKGILYFPKRNNDYESYEGQIKLFYNQVFVADDIKEVIPEYLLMLRGVLDCPELPLNVSRSYLQDNAYVKKVAAHIVKKVADKLVSMANNDRDKYTSVWSELKLFSEYASLRDRKFYDRVKSSYLLELTDGTYMTDSEYLEYAKNSHENTIYYATDKNIQAQYISMFENEGIKVALLSHTLDTQYISMCEDLRRDVKYKRIDSDIADIIKGDGEHSLDINTLTSIFRKASGNEKLEVKTQALKDEKTPALLTLSEDSRRMQDMMKMYANMGMDIGKDMPAEYTLVLNSASPLIDKIAKLDDEDKATLMASHIYMLSLMSQKNLSESERAGLLKSGFDIMELL